MLKRYENTQTFSITSAVLGGIFAFGAIAHLGVLPIDEPVNISAMLIEVVCGAAMFAAAGLLHSQNPNGFRIALAAHVFAIVSLVLGMFAVALGFGTRTDFLSGFNAVMLLLLGLNTFGLWRTRPRNPIKRAQYRIAARLY